MDLQLFGRNVPISRELAKNQSHSKKESLINTCSVTQRIHRYLIVDSREIKLKKQWAMEAWMRQLMASQLMQAQHQCSAWTNEKLHFAASLQQLPACTGQWRLYKCVYTNSRQVMSAKCDNNTIQLIKKLQFSSLCREFQDAVEDWRASGLATSSFLLCCLILM